MNLNNEFMVPEWKKRFSDIICGFSLPKIGNQALTRKSISLKTTTKQNRKMLADILDLDSSRMFSPHQIHSGKVIFVDNCNVGRGSLFLKDAIKGDACVTKNADVLLLVTWADCIPVLLYDSENKVIGAVHSGWKGTVSNIIRNTIETMRNLNTKIENIYAAIGPAIRSCCYKVGEEFVDYFSGIGQKEMILKKKEGIYLDLAGCAYKQLIDAGVIREKIDFSGLCTCCNENPSFFSYRKDREKFEAQAAFICIKDNQDD